MHGKNTTTIEENTALVNPENSSNIPVRNVESMDITTRTIVNIGPADQASSRTRRSKESDTTVKSMGTRSTNTTRE